MALLTVPTSAQQIITEAFSGTYTPSESLLDWKSTRAGASVWLTDHAHLIAFDLPLTGARSDRAVTIYDWASTARGAGRELYKRAVASRTLLSIGGSRAGLGATRAMGFSEIGAMGVYEFERTPVLDDSPRSYVRCVRQLWRGLHQVNGLASIAGPVVPDLPVEVALPSALVPSDSGIPAGLSWPLRTSRSLQSLMECPVLDPTLVAVRDAANSTVTGYAVITQREPDYCEIADFRTFARDRRAWAWNLRAVMSHLCTRRVRCMATSQLMDDVLLAIGFRRTFELPVFSNVSDLDVRSLHLSGVDGDMFLM